MDEPNCDERVVSYVGEGNMLLSLRLQSFPSLTKLAAKLFSTALSSHPTALIGNGPTIATVFTALASFIEKGRSWSMGRVGWMVE